MWNQMTFKKTANDKEGKILKEDKHISKILFQNLFITAKDIQMSRGSAVGIAIGYALGDRGVGVRVPVGSRIFTSPYRPDWL
jgi:hypothetical protein